MVFDEKKEIRNIVFRVDASTQIGSGHLIRCLTLAKRLKKENQAQVTFISRNLEGNMNFLVEENGYTLFCLPESENNKILAGYESWLSVEKKVDAEQTRDILKKLCADCLVVDSYAIDEEWEKIQRPYVKKIMVIDDLADRKHDCDILLDQNYYKDMKMRYNGLVPDYCKLLLGPKHALLRDEFYKERKHLRYRNGAVKRILVFFGGSDLTNETMKALQAIAAKGRVDIYVDVVVGAINKQKEEVKQFCRQHEYMKYHCQVGNMAELMHKADLAIGAGGSTTWERCFLGLPAIVVAIADNQVKICEDCNEINIIFYLGESKDVDKDKILQYLGKYISDPLIGWRICESCKTLFNE